MTMISGTYAHARTATLTPSSAVGDAPDPQVYGPFVPGHEPKSTTGDTTKPPPGQPAATVHSSDPGDQALVERALHVLDGTAHGAPVSKALREDHTPIQVMSDADFNAKFPGAGGVYDPKSNTMYLPRSGLQQPRLLAIVLAHEGTHHLDDKHDIPVVATIFRDMFLSIGDSFGALVHGHNPMTGWIDGIDAHQHRTEINAYTTQAQVSAELGVREYPYDLGENADGSVASRDEIAARLHDTSLYRRDTKQRMILGGMGVLMSSSLAGLASISIAARVKPGSYLALHQWPVAGPIAAIGGALLLADALTYKKDIGRDPGTKLYH